MGTFGSVFLNPIINQPQVGILALELLESASSYRNPEGDFIGIRQKCSYRIHMTQLGVVDGAWD